MTPRRVGRAAGEPAIDADRSPATSQVSRERSGLISVQFCPPFVVFQSVFDAKNSGRGSVGENSTGAVRSTR